MSGTRRPANTTDRFKDLETKMNELEEQNKKLAAQVQQANAAAAAAVQAAQCAAGSGMTDMKG
jgi:hypothetical protein